MQIIFQFSVKGKRYTHSSTGRGGPCRSLLSEAETVGPKLTLSSVHTTRVHGPCSRAVSTHRRVHGREHGCQKWHPCARAVLDTLVINTAREQGRYSGSRDMVTARKHG